jgi:polysaccharide biosynthesis transport protein
MNREIGPTQQSMGLREYLAVLKRHRWLIAPAVLVAMAAALIYSSRQVPVYTSNAQVLVEVSASSSASTTTAPINMETERSIASSPQVAKNAADRLEQESPTTSLSGALSVDVIPGTEILVFGYSSVNPQIAEEGVEAFARGYLEHRRQRALDEALEVAESIQLRIDDAEARLRDVNQEIQETADETRGAVLRQERSGLITQIGLLQQELVAGRGAVTDSGQVIQPASQPVTSETPLGRILALALVAGLGLGIGLAFLMERLDDRLRGRADLEKHSGVPVLAVVPRVTDWKRRNDAYLATLEAPDSTTAEAYRTLRTGVLFAASQHRLQTLLITSPEAGEGKTTTAANLAVALARAGKKVILMSADLRKPRLQMFFNERGGRGLTNVLAGEQATEQALVRPRAIANLAILPSGPIPGNPAELLTSAAMARTLEELKGHADMVLLDAAPVLAVADALALSRTVDGVLLVADAHRSSRTAVDQARHQLNQVNARLVGSVLNNLNPRKSAGYIPYDNYYYAREAR